jgi:hypothetical protein
MYFLLDFRYTFCKNSEERFEMLSLYVLVLNPPKGSLQLVSYSSLERFEAQHMQSISCCAEVCVH